MFKIRHSRLTIAICLRIRNTFIFACFAGVTVNSLVNMKIHYLGHPGRTMQNIHPPFRGALWESNHPCMPVIKSRPTFTTLPFYNFLLWVLLGVLTFPCCVRCLIFKVGVLGPWNCDPVQNRALPAAAARLAVNRINGDLNLDLGLKLDFIILQEPCETSTALTAFIYNENKADVFIGPTNPGYCVAASLLSKNWDKAIFSYGCVNYELDWVMGYPTFSRTVPFPSEVLFIVLKYFRWASVVVISSNEDIWRDTAARVATALRREGLPVGLVTSIGMNETEMESTLRKIQEAGEIRGESMLTLIQELAIITCETVYVKVIPDDEKVE